MKGTLSFLLDKIAGAAKAIIHQHGIQSVSPPICRLSLFETPSPSSQKSDLPENEITEAKREENAASKLTDSGDPLVFSINLAIPSILSDQRSSAPKSFLPSAWVL